ncbi:MAG: hypothetical protein Q7U88_12250 [Desulfocapsaceae bacterium]|nr:hypothetical protein [Desulfocapsaceae bacterium]
MDNNPLFKLIENVGKLRDGFLVIVTIFYITGYVAWSYIAWTNGLGALPVLDAQYLIAGIPPILTALLVFIIIRFLKAAFLVKWPTYFLSMALSQQIIIQLCIFVMPIGSLALILLLEKFNWPSQDEYRICSIVTSFVLMVLFYLLFEPKIILEKFFEKIEKDKSSILFENYKSVLKKIVYFSIDFFLVKNKLSYIYTLPTIAGLAAIYLYLSVLYPQIPYGFGGAKPRVATLDIVRSEFSLDTINWLVDATLSTKVNNILSTKKITIYLETKDIILIGVESASNNEVKKFEISRNAVKSIQWMSK